jgi:hypothetical protein
MAIGLVIFVLLSVVVLLIGGRFWQNRRLPANRATLYTATAVLMVTGLLLIMIGSVQVRRDLDIGSWPAVTGKIVSSEVVGSRAFHPRVAYRYVVDGTEYEGISDLKMPGFGGKRNRLETSEILIHEYPPGSEVVVHYDPEDHAVSTLNPGLSYAPCMQTALGILVYLGGVFLLPWRFRLRRPRL